MNWASIHQLEYPTYYLVRAQIADNCVQIPVWQKVQQPVADQVRNQIGEVGW